MIIDFCDNIYTCTVDLANNPFNLELCKRIFSVTYKRGSRVTAVQSCKTSQEVIVFVEMWFILKKSLSL